MSDENQAIADSADTETVVDPLDAANSTNSGTNPIAAYEAELAAALAAEAENDALGDEPADELPADEVNENADEPEDATPDDEPEEEEPEPVAKAKDRFRFKDPLDQKIAAVAKAMGVNLIEAAKIVEGQNPTKHQEDAPEARESVAEVTATIKDLQTQKRDLLASLDFEAAAELEAQIDDLRDKRDDLKISEAAEKSNAQQREVADITTRFEADREKFLKFYPDAVTAFNGQPPATEMAKEILRLNAEWETLGDPLFHHPEKAGVLMKEAAKNLGIPMVNPAKAPASKKATANRPIQPASGNARTTATAPAIRLDEAIDKIGSINEYERLVASLH